jgi:hypothetical protein
VDLWPTVTQTNGSGFANFLIGGGLNNTKANDGVIWAGGAANAITVTLFGNGTLSIRDQSLFNGADGEYIYFNGSAFSNNGFKKLSIVTSAFASGSQTLSFYLDDTVVLKNYTRAAGFTSDNHVGFQATGTKVRPSPFSTTSTSRLASSGRAATAIGLLASVQLFSTV